MGIIRKVAGGFAQRFKEINQSRKEQGIGVQKVGKHDVGLGSKQFGLSFGKLTSVLPSQSRFASSPFDRKEAEKKKNKKKEEDDGIGPYKGRSYRPYKPRNFWGY